MKDAARLLPLLFPEENGRQRSSAESHEIGKGAHDERDGKDNAEPRDGKRPRLTGDGADVHSVHKIIEKIDDLRDNGRNGQAHDESADLISAEVNFFCFG